MTLPCWCEAGEAPVLDVCSRACADTVQVKQLKSFPPGSDGMGLPVPCDALGHLCCLSSYGQGFPIHFPAQAAAFPKIFLSHTSQSVQWHNSALSGAEVHGFLPGSDPGGLHHTFHPFPRPRSATFLKHTFLQLLGFVKLKSMFAKPLQLLGWKVVSQSKYHLINKEVSCLLQRRAREGLWEQNHSSWSSFCLQT